MLSRSALENVLASKSIVATTDNGSNDAKSHLPFEPFSNEHVTPLHDAA